MIKTYYSIQCATPCGRLPLLDKNGRTMWGSKSSAEKALNIAKKGSKTPLRIVGVKMDTKSLVFNTLVERVQPLDERFGNKELVL